MKLFQKRHLDDKEDSISKKKNGTDIIKQTAIIKILFWWRTVRINTISRLINRLLSCNLTITYCKNITFENVVPYLRQQYLINITKKCLERLHRLSILLHKVETYVGHVNIRIFLSSYMVALYKDRVFDKPDGELEVPLFESAKALINLFETICIELSSGKCFHNIDKELTKLFPIFLMDYLDKFKKWKLPDEIKLIRRIKHALVALFNAQNHLPPDEPEDSRLSIEFRTQINNLRIKLIQIGGENAYAELVEEYRTNPHAFTVQPAGNTTIGGRVTNEELAYELLLDPEYRLSEDDATKMNIFQESFFNSLVDDLKYTQPDYTRIKKVIEDIITGIKDCKLDADIDGTVLLNRFNKSDFNNSMIKDICVIIFNTLITITNNNGTIIRWTVLTQNDVLSPEDNVEVLKFLLNTLNKIKVEKANERLALIAPVIRDHGIEYQRGKFQDKLNRGHITLVKVLKQITYVTKKEYMANPVVKLLLLNGDEKTHDRIYYGLIIYVISMSDTIKDNCPETMLFDITRLENAQLEFKFIVISSLILVRLSNSRKLEEKVFEDINNYLVHETNQIKYDQLLINVVELANNDPEIKIILLSSNNMNDPVNKLIILRLSAYYMSLFVNKDAIYSFIPTSKKFESRIVESVNKLSRMIIINKEIHKHIYSQLAIDAVNSF